MGKCSVKRECQWARPETRPRWRRSVDEGIHQDTPDIGPDTCGNDRHTLSQWFLSHGMPELLLDPIPALVLPTDPNPYDDPNNPHCPPIKSLATVASNGRRPRSLQRDSKSTRSKIFQVRRLWPRPDLQLLTRVSEDPAQHC